MQCKEERPILDVVEVETVGSAREVEGTNKPALICEKRAVDKVCSRTVLWS